MAAHDLLNGVQFYHGTPTHIPDDTIRPGQRQANAVPTEEGKHDRSAYFSGHYAYAATDPDVAFDHALEGDVPTLRQEHRQVLPVSPIGIPRRDPEDDNHPPTSFMSRQGWKIQPHNPLTKRLTGTLQDTDY